MTSGHQEHKTLAGDGGKAYKEAVTLRVLNVDLNTEPPTGKLMLTMLREITTFGGK